MAVCIFPLVLEHSNNVRTHGGAKTNPVQPTYRISCKVSAPPIFRHLVVEMRTNPPNFAKSFPTVRREKSCTSWKRAVDTFSFKTSARRHASNYSVLLELLPRLLPNKKLLGKQI